VFWLPLLLAIQAPLTDPTDALAAEVLDYRGRRDECEYRDRAWIEWRLWRCDELARDAASLRSRLTSRPDLLARFDTKVEDNEKLVIVMANESHSAKLGRLIQEGTLWDGRKARVTVDTDPERLSAITLEVAGQRPRVIRFEESIEYPDIRSTRLTWYRRMIGVRLNFGVEHPWCFADQDGVSELSVTVEGSTVRAARRDVVKCDIVSRDVKVSTRPAQNKP